MLKVSLLKDTNQTKLFGICFIIMQSDDLNHQNHYSWGHHSFIRITDVKAYIVQRCVLPVFFPVDLYTTMAVINPPEKKLANRTSVHWCAKISTIHTSFNKWNHIQLFCSLGLVKRSVDCWNFGITLYAGALEET